MAMKNKKREAIYKALEGVKMSDAGMKEKPMRDMPVAKSGPRVDYPSLYLNVKQVPKLADYEVGDKVDMVIEGKVIAHNKKERSGSDGYETFDVEIRKIGCTGK